MALHRKAHIIGMGTYVPERVLTNFDFEKMVETSDEWIVTRTGIRERRIAAPHETTSDMGVVAARRALEDSGLALEHVGLILVPTMTPDFPTPSTGALIQAKLGAQNVPAFDITAACSGYVYALSVAKAYVESGMYDNVLIVAAEKMSAFTDYQDRATCIVFGDGAAAVVVSREARGYEIGPIVLGADGGQAPLMQIPAGGSALPASSETVANRQHYFRMNGREVFKSAVRIMEMVARECIARAGVHLSEVRWLIPHQANGRIVEALQKRCDLPEDRVCNVIEKYGNTSAASIPTAMADLVKEGKIVDGDYVLLVAFGAGATWGAALVKKVSAVRMS